MLVTIVIFVMAGLAEIGGGYLIWLWLREGKSIFLGLAGGFRAGVIRHHCNISNVPYLWPCICCIWRGFHCSFCFMGVGHR